MTDPKPPRPPRDISHLMDSASPELRLAIVDANGHLYRICANCGTVRHVLYGQVNPPPRHPAEWAARVQKDAELDQCDACRFVARFGPRNVQPPDPTTYQPLGSPAIERRPRPKRRAL